MTRTCIECGTAFRTNDNRMRYCDGVCRQKAYRKRVAAEREQAKSTEIVVPSSISAKLKLIARLAAELEADIAATYYVDPDEVMTAKQATVIMHRTTHAMDVKLKEINAIIFAAAQDE